MRDILNWFVEEVKKVYGGNLISVLLYGSKATGVGAGAQSDFNVLIVIDKVSAEQLRELEKPVREWVKVGNPAPQIFSGRMLSGSPDVFPIEFLDMKARHKVLFGKDPLESVTVDDRNLRHQCEYELKVKLLNLRKMYMLAGNEKELKAILVNSISPVLSILKYSVRLFGEQAPEDRMEALKILENKSGIRKAVFETILKMKHGEPGAGKTDVKRIFGEYLDELEKLVEAVDNARIRN